MNSSWNSTISRTGIKMKFLFFGKYIFMKVIVASGNPVKVNATKAGFSAYFDEVIVESCKVESGVSDQPMTDAETLEGARNRTANAKKLLPDADFWVGIEGGVERNTDGLTAFAWIVIHGKNISGESRTTTFMLPKRVTDLIDEGYELGVANDMIFNEHNSKQNSGAVGLLTQNTITRTQLYEQAVHLALIPVINKKMY